MDYKKIDFSKINLSQNYRFPLNRKWTDVLNQGLEFSCSHNNKLFVRWMYSWDVSEVQKIERQIFPSPWSLEGFLFRLSDRDYNVSIVGLEDGRIIAYAISYVIYDEFHFSNLAVLPENRGFGFGKAMLWMSLQIAIEKKCRHIHLEVRKSNEAAIHLYKKFGFDISGVRVNYYRKENEDALLMHKKINLENSYGLV